MEMTSRGSVTGYWSANKTNILFLKCLSFKGGVGPLTLAEKAPGTGLTASPQSQILSGLLTDHTDPLGQTSSASMRLMDTSEQIVLVTTLWPYPFVRFFKT